MMLFSYSNSFQREIGDGTGALGFDRRMTMTNTSGAIVAEYTYDAYGNITAMSGSQAADNPIRFSTKYFDGDTGYYDFGFRSYDPVTGRWLNRDPIGEEGGLNLYGFVGNSPGNVLDGYGLAVLEVHTRRVIGPFYGIRTWGSHAFILLWDTDKNEKKIGTPWVIAGYNSNVYTRKNDGLLHPYIAKFDEKCPDYPYINDDQYNDPYYYEGIAFSTNPDNKSAQAYLKRFREIESAIEKKKIRYFALGTNSNATARTMLEEGLGLTVSGVGVWAPGWKRNLLGGPLKYRGRTWSAPEKK